MEKEKIQQFFKLLDGVTACEWDILKCKANMLYKMKASTNKLAMSEHAISFMTEDTIENLAIFDDIKSDAKHTF
ncbi:MAG: hypothetical protein LKI17_06185 [Megasphaera cerevisiae]|jgi:hypothetical protein|nr:hypothetical protein [Megasphaera cerevisiae]